MSTNIPPGLELAELRAEIEALRRDVAAWRAEQATLGRQHETTDTSKGARASVGSLTDQLHDLAREISAVAEDAEKGVLEHPITSVLAALVLGIIIGRILPRS